MYKILLTCPPMLKQSERYQQLFEKYNLDVDCPDVNQIMTEDELCDLLPKYDGWIIGDDPATRKVFEAGKNGKLKAAVKWGVGVDNVDLEACKDLGIPITNIPGVFGEEVSDIAIGYLLCLNRKLHLIDAEVKKGIWAKYTGNSLSNKKACLIGFGDIGRCTARKLLAFNIDVCVSDPGFERVDGLIHCKYDDKLIVPDFLNAVNLTSLEEAVTCCDFIIITCALNSHTNQLVNKDLILKSNRHVKIINVARGPIVKESDVIELLEDGFVDAVGFDVFNIEPLKLDNELRKFEQNMFGSHNGSNTIEAVDKTSKIAIQRISQFLNSI